LGGGGGKDTRKENNLGGIFNRVPRKPSGVEGGRIQRAGSTVNAKKKKKFKPGYELGKRGKRGVKGKGTQTQHAQGEPASRQNVDAQGAQAGQSKTEIKPWKKLRPRKGGKKKRGVTGRCRTGG